MEWRRVGVRNLFQAIAGKAKAVAWRNKQPRVWLGPEWGRIGETPVPVHLWAL